MLGFSAAEPISSSSFSSSLRLEVELESLLPDGEPRPTLSSLKNSADPITWGSDRAE